MHYPCKECKKRFLGCHDTCEDYQTVKKKDEAIKQRRFADYEANYFERDRHNRIDSWARRHDK